MRLFFIIFILFSSIYAIDGVKNIKLNTIDSDEVRKNVANRFSKVDLKNLKSNPNYKRHIKNIERLKGDIKELIALQKDLRVTQNEYEDEVKKYNSAEGVYNKKMTRIYAENDIIKRVSYYVVAHKLDQEYMPSLKNYLIDKDAIEKYEQNTEIKESTYGVVSYKNTVSTNKYFGQMQVETLRDLTYRDKDLNIKILKVIQTPFAKSSSSEFSKAFQKDIDKFDESLNLEVFKIDNIKDLQSKYISKLKLSKDEVSKVLSAVKENVNISRANKSFDLSTKKIRSTLKKITKEHDKYIKNLNDSSIKINKLSSILEDKKEKLLEKTEVAQKLAKYYSITLNFDELEKMVIITPKLYSEHVVFGEEKDFILRKTKSYLSNISIAQIQQSETLSESYDLSTKNLNKTKLIEYESIHIFPFVKGKELATLIFGVIELEDKISSESHIRKDLKYANISFVPINKGYKTIFAATTEISLGVVKEFLETHRQRKYFDTYCIEDSTLPDEAKDFENVEEEYYDYPAVCFKVERVDEFMQWLGEKLDKKVRLARVDEWSYVASNSNSSDYCWGNESIEELNMDGLRPENIYYEDGEDTYIQPIKSFEKSRLGIYDMCGNVHELVQEGPNLMIKGNSYISFIEKSNAPALEYTSDLNTMIGIRAFYVKER